MQSCFVRQRLAGIRRFHKLRVAESTSEVDAVYREVIKTIGVISFSSETIEKKVSFCFVACVFVIGVEVDSAYEERNSIVSDDRQRNSR